MSLCPEWTKRTKRHQSKESTGETQSYISCCQRRVLNNCINGQYIRSNRGIKVSLIIIMHLRTQMVNVFHSKE